MRYQNVSEEFIELEAAPAIAKKICTQSTDICLSIIDIDNARQLNFENGCANIRVANDGLIERVSAGDLLTFYGIQTLIEGRLWQLAPGSAPPITFQMYSPNRQQQIAFVRRNLKAKGLMIFLEKFRSQDIEEYRRRELEKDHGFKIRYFSEAEINRKKTNVLDAMNLNEVALDEMRCVLREVFSYAYIIWNSGNFYSIAASNSLRNLDLFVSCLGPAAIPSEYTHGEVPARFLPDP
ncbi:hypothetical protein [Agrobacterium pusense]|uniref:Uncharacterized protein n=1 Tax=Agrobacterium pusense TaxID=648995 RepID=A0AA44EHW0_9HYPH|nr:hypothetical protein [Agrobacterium pusense]MDH0117982.1 hypothetical protein [Agrobacterium pusense]NRF07639.1 hypothetical protein [Agrobacterium pusense]NRF18372.1 hypothetical protein [Agrobacterium pusense]